MAKLTAPLLSFDARGKLASTLVYMGWKGIKTVRQYVIPANPNSAAQQTQRGFMSDMVNEWQSFDAAAKAAWNLWAPFEASPMSGFNSATKAGIPLITADADAPMSDQPTSTPAASALDITTIMTKISDQSAVPSLATIEVHSGTTPRTLDDVQALVWNVSLYEGTISGLTTGTQYYMRIYDTAQAAYVGGLFSDVPI